MSEKHPRCLHVIGILYNHESPRRGDMFVTKKITKTLAEIRACVRTKPLELGFLDAKRDWGHAKDYVRAMWMMLQAENLMIISCVWSNNILFVTL